jgi:hypothetical protein
MVAIVGTVVVVVDLVDVVVVVGTVVGTVVVVVNEVDGVVLVDAVEVVVATRVVLDVDDVGVVVVGARVVDDVDDVDDVEEVEAPTNVTLMTFDGPLSDGTPGLAAWLSATMATVSVSVCPAAGPATENVSVQGVAAQTTDAGWLSTWVQVLDAETKLSWVQTVASP